MILTTAIYYTNGKLHIGHAMELVCSDILSRYYRQVGASAYLTTGLDEHVTKVVDAAKLQKKSPQDYCDEIAKVIQGQMNSFGIMYQDFIRTTESRHEEAVKEFWTRAFRKGDLYKKKYQGWYCEKSDQYFLEKDLGPNKESPESGKPCVWKEEENYFFKASRYEAQIRQLLQTDFIYPDYRAKEMLEFIKDGLQDFSVTRQNLEFAISVPGDESHKIYVWFDALINYVTVCGFPQSTYKDKWPVDFHIIGKDINRFHSVWWPAMLLSADLPLPKKIIVHGFVNQNNEKMGKSKGNAIDPDYLIKSYGRDAFRYFFTTSSFLNDINWDEKVLIDKFNAEVVNDFSNFFSRSVTILKKFEITQLPFDQLSFKWPNLIDPHDLSSKAFEIFRSLNKKFNEAEPWKMNKDECEKILAPMVSQAMAAFELLRPILIDGALELDKLIKKNKDSWQIFGVPKLYRPLILQESKIPQVVTKMSKETSAMNFIEFDDFLKLDIKVAKILTAEILDGSDKLLKLSVDAGEESPRTVVSGIRKYYQPDELIGKKVCLLTNLKPRKIFGIESQGMILAASNKNNLSVLSLLQESGLEPGDKIS